MSCVCGAQDGVAHFCTGAPQPYAGTGWSYDVRKGYPPDKFDAVWNVIRGWDIQRTPGDGYAGATGTDVAAILDSLLVLP